MKKILVILILCWAWVKTPAQTISFEQQALTAVQQMPASSLDPELPARSFQTWFNELIGPRAGVIWQLTECGERISAQGETESDLPACAEVTAGLPDGGKVIVVITVGTFKKGLTGRPAFFRAVVERNEQLRPVQRLCEVAEVLLMNTTRPRSLGRSKSGALSIKLPALKPNPAGINFPFYAARILPTSPIFEIVPQGLIREEAPAPPPAPSSTPQALPETQDVAEGVLRGNATTKVKPSYPLSARKMNALGPVEVRILISETGTVIDAKALSGHMALRGAAVEAASRWVFRPTTINRTPVKVQGILTFIFTPSEK